MTIPDIKSFISSFFHHHHTFLERDEMGWWLVNNSHQRETEEAMKDLWNESPSTISQETFSDLEAFHRTIGEEKKAKVRRMQVLRWAAAAVIVVAISVTATFFCTKGYLMKHYQGEDMVKTMVADGQQREITLPDSTKVVMAGGSTLISPSEFKGKTRTVFLIGMAYFRVAKDKEHPFIVRTQGMAVQALGTRFAVDAYPASESERTMLEQGATSVTVEDDRKKGDSWRMRPGQCLVYNRTTGDVTLMNVDNSYASNWTKGWMEFNGEPFYAIANALQHRFGVQIKCSNMQSLRGKYYVKFGPTESLNDVLTVLSTLGTHFTFRHEGNVVYIEVPR